MAVKQPVASTVKRAAQLVRDNRKAAGLTQRELADMAEIGKTAVFDIEKGKLTVQLDTLLKVFRVLGIEVHLKAPVDKTGGGQS